MMLGLRFSGYLLLLSALLVSCRGSRNLAKPGAGNPESNSARAFAEAYSAKLGVPVPENANRDLIIRSGEWIGVPYKFGGNDKKGVDCSGLIANIYPQVYKISVPRVSAQLYREANPVNRKNLQEGDLVFFKINTPDVGHAGILLFADYFLHASTSKGVMVSRLAEPYWNKYFVGGGRFSR